MREAVVHVYGMRTGVSSWERGYVKDREIRIVVYGDEFVVTGNSSELELVKDVFVQKYSTEVREDMKLEDCELNLLLGSREQRDKKGSILEGEHDEVENLWLREAVRDQKIELIKVLSAENLVDLLMKFLPRAMLDRLVYGLGHEECLSSVVND